MVSDEAIMMLMALQFGFMAFVLMKLDVKKSDSERFKNEIEKTLSSIAIPNLNLDSIKDELVEVVEDLMQNMRIPSIADHLGGAVAQFMQMKQMKLAQDMGLTQPEVGDQPFENEDF